MQKIVNKAASGTVDQAHRPEMDSFGSPWPASPRGGLEGLSNDGVPMDALAELQDGAFEPQTRARSNTWPLPRPENFVEPEAESESNKCSNQQLASAGKWFIASFFIFFFASPLVVDIRLWQTLSFSYARISPPLFICDSVDLAKMWIK